MKECVSELGTKYPDLSPSDGVLFCYHPYDPECVT